MSSKCSLTSLLPSLNLSHFIAFDLETTGLDHNKDKITEIAACRFINGEVKEKFSTLVNPNIPIPKKIVEITGITDEMLADAPSIDDALPLFLAFLDTSSLVGHNIEFDHRFINDNCIRKNIALPELIMYDTLSLARTFTYFYNSFSLGSLCDYYNIYIDQAHRAGPDALATGELFQCIIQEATSRPLILTQKINDIIKHGKSLYNSDLFSNILKTSISKNKVNGLMDSLSDYISPNNIFSSNEGSIKNKLPKTPMIWFEDDGLLNSKFLKYEKRLSQIDLIRDAYAAFIEDNILVAEAGTGLGKSIAYLAAGIFSAKQKDRTLVVSTHTKNLQAQLFDKDIPQLSKALDIKINAVIYKGRHNYICRTRLENLINNHAHLISPNEYEALMILMVWEWETKTGDINECVGFQLNRFKRLWSLVRSERGYCSTHRCSRYEGCYLGGLRNRIKDVDIIIVNHSLFVNELQSENTTLPDNFIYVVDEAHHFANDIRSQLVQEFGIQTLNDVFKYFDQDKKNGKILSFKKYPALYKVYKEIAEDSEIIRNELLDFFNSYYSNRYQDITESGYYIDKHLYNNIEQEFIDTSPNIWEILNSLNQFEIKIQKLSDIMIKYKDQISQSILIEFDMIKDCLEDGISTLKSVLDSSNDVVKWSSFIKKESHTQVILNSAPLKVNRFIYDHLLNCHSGGLFCSATLTVNDEFDYFLEKTGLNLSSLNHQIEKKIYPSPFYYEDQVKLFVYNHSIDVKDPTYMEEIADQINKLSLSFERRMLVLCTSYKQTLTFRKLLEPVFKRDDRRLIIQKPGISRNLMVRNYLEHAHSVLIGTSSFWEGVDFPGDKVELLCIVKTPFDNPYDPMIKSQIEDYTQHGENAFLKYQVPEAAMKLRQGFGRLIRNMNDTGICIIMDTRLCHRRYGKIILDSLPVKPIPYQYVEKLISDSQKFF